MRNENEIFELIIDKAVSDSRIRAVLLNGSWVHSKFRRDTFQDFDIIYIVNDIHTFTNDHSWTDYFGEKLIEQLPDTMDLYPEDRLGVKLGFAYLMLFTDGNRIDLTLYPFNQLKNFQPESLTKILIDKDAIFTELPLPAEEDYLIKIPSQKEFSDVCNEFWWVSSYVAKGLARAEITYAKSMETVIREMFMKMVAWYIGTKTFFSKSFGKGGRFMQQYLSKEMYQRILATYSSYVIEDNWRALFLMTNLFAEFARQVAFALNLVYAQQEEINITSYLQKVHQQAIQ